MPRVQLPVCKRLALWLGLAASVGLAGCGGNVPAPKAFKAHIDGGGKFVCDAPEGWEVSSGGKPDSPNSFAKFSSGSALISVTADFAGSLFGDIARSTGGQGADAEPPVARVHPMGERSMKEDYSDYKEREPVAFQSKGLGEGRRSTFTAKQTIGGNVYGYRATLLSGDRRITVVTTCPATNWKDLKPAFERVIASLRMSP
jgi:hypothetical protein